MDNLKHTPTALAQDELERLKLKLKKNNEEISFYGEKNDFDSLVHLDTLLEIQNNLEEQIKLLESTLMQVKSNKNVGFTIEFDNDVKSYKVVEDNHIVDPINNIISKDSPLAQAVLGKKEGDIFELLTPFGSKLGRVLKI